MERGVCGRGRRAVKPHRSISTKLRTSKEETLVQKNMKRQRKAELGAVLSSPSISTELVVFQQDMVTHSRQQPILNIED